MAVPTTVELGDLELARIGLGTNRLTNTRDRVAFLKAAVAAGVRMIDTAHSYTSGQSEETIGEALAPFDNELVVATKGGIGGPGRGRPEVLRAEIDESFRRLRTDTIALYYLHRVDPQTPIEESVGAIKDNVDRGRIRHIGISEVRIEDIERARKVAPIGAVQNHYNIAERGSDAVVDYCTKEGIVFVPFFPLRAQVSSAVTEVAQRRRATPQQIMLAWLLHRSPLMLPIPGTLSLEHLRDNLAALKIELSDSELRALG